MSERLSALFSSSQSVDRVLDLRESTQFKEQSLLFSVNIPLPQLIDRLAELPDKTTPFLVLLPQHYEKTQTSVRIRLPQPGLPPVSTTSAPFHSSERKASDSQTIFIDTENVILFFEDRGWIISGICRASPEFWELAKKENLIRSVLASSVQERRTLFDPCPLLSEWIDYVTNDCVEARIHEGATWKAGVERPVELRCLDLGCGSGRDIAWIASTSPASKAPDGCKNSHQWTAYGIDSWKGSVKRATQLAENLGVSDSIHVVQASLSADGGILWHNGSFARPVERPTPHTGTPQDLRAIIENEEFDLVLCVRFLSRPHFKYMKERVRKGGFLIHFSFCSGVEKHPLGHPSDPNDIVEEGELARFFSQNDFEILLDEVRLLPDGRPVNAFVSRKN